MNDEELILAILIDRDIEAFVANDWNATARDFDAEHFVGYSAETGVVRLDYPTLDSYRVSWLAQAQALTPGRDEAELSAQLHAVQRLDRIDIQSDRALAVKVFDGVMDDAAGTPQTLRWTTYYFLRFDGGRQRWLITGFMGYLPSEWSAA